MRYFNLLLITFISLILVMGLASATTIGGGIQNNCIDLTQTCANCTFVNITSIQYPNQTKSITNYAMTKQGTEYNYTFCNTDSIGEYWYNTLGDPDGIKTIEPISFSISSTGVEQTTGQSIASALFIVLMLGLTIMFAWVGFKLSESENMWIAGIFFLFLGLIMLTYDVWLGVEYSRNWVGTDNSTIPQLIFWMFLTIITIGLLSTIALLFANWKQYWRKYKQYLKRKNDFNDEDLEFDLE